MAHTITRRVINNGKRRYSILFTVTGDGASGELSGVIVNAISGDMSTDNKLLSVDGALDSFSAFLAWDASSPVNFLELPAGRLKQKFKGMGGLVNNGGVGKTGDIKITTKGLAASSLAGSFILEVVKR